MNAVVSALEGSRHETQISPKSEAASSPVPGAFDIGNGDKTIEVGDGRGLRAGARELDMEWCPWEDRARDRSGRARTRSGGFRQTWHPQASRDRHTTGGRRPGPQLAPP